MKKPQLNEIFTVIQRFIARRKLVLPAALLLVITTRHGRKFGDKSLKNILIIPKDAFVDDVETALGSRGFRIHIAHRLAFKALASGILPPQLDDNAYVSNDSAVQHAKLEYRNFLVRVCRWYKRLLPFDAVMTGNFSYYAERELAAALDEIGIPFIALHKENLKSAGRVDFFTRIYRERRGPFLGRRILVYNKIEREVQLASGVITPEHITITGMPRLDRVHIWRRSNRARTITTPLVLFFSFAPKTGLPRIARKARSGITGGFESLDGNLDELAWETLALDTHRAIFELARNNPSLQVIIKAKGREREWVSLNYVRDEMRPLPDNLKIIIGDDPLDLITQARVVCGFNTTGLLEAVAAGCKVVVPAFAEANDPNFTPYIIDLEESVEYAHSPKELIAKLRAAAQTQKPIPLELEPRHIQMLEKWTGNADGEAGRRVAEAVRAEISGGG